MSKVYLVKIITDYTYVVNGSKLFDDTKTTPISVCTTKEIAHAHIKEAYEKAIAELKEYHRDIVEVVDEHEGWHIVINVADDGGVVSDLLCTICCEQIETDKFIED